MESLLNKKFVIVLAAFILASVFILWEHFNGGVVTHYLLAREDLPGISNFWGLLSIPLLTWLVISLINKRRDKTIKSDPTNLEIFYSKTLKGFLAALLFGIIASLLWEFRLASYLEYFILAPFLIALFKPVHFPEYLLGFVIGMLFTFGGILPILVGIVLLVICFSINTLIRILKNVFIKK